jgi:hypothetical protein
VNGRLHESVALTVCRWHSSLWRARSKPYASNQKGAGLSPDDDTELFQFTSTFQPHYAPDGGPVSDGISTRNLSGSKAVRRVRLTKWDP